MTIQKADVLWRYMSSFNGCARSDAVVVCCSYDLRVCDYACDLIRKGISNTLVLSGNTGNWTKHLWTQPEAVLFKERALTLGIAEEAILLEDRATNFGENILFSKELLPDAKTITFVSKPSALLRVMLTAQAQWPEVKAFVTCPDIVFPDDVSNVVGILGVINEMVGDLERVQKYPELGFQVPHSLPDEIMDAWNYLIGQGFTEHLMKR